jgi:tetratricopeptide (TPR) repeat protein
MRLTSTFVAAAAVAACSSAALAGDILQRKDGSFSSPVAGDQPTATEFDASKWQVLDADNEVVKYQFLIGDKPQYQTQKSVEVLEIWLEPKDYPGSWKEAMNAMASGAYGDAAEAFRAIGAEARVHPVIRQKALLFVGRAFAAWGKPGEAEAAYEALFKAFPKTFYTIAVWKDRSQMWMDANDEAKARAAADTLLKLPGVSDADKLESGFLLVTIDFRKATTAGDKAGIQSCLDKFKALAQQTKGSKEQAGVNALAKIGVGNCLLELGNAGEAKAIFEEITQAKGNEKAVDAAAFNGLGECFFRMNTKEGFVEARRCFLRTSLLYTEGTSADQIARALYFAGECFVRVGDDNWASRARQELGDCIRRFPSSPWTQKAKNLYTTVPKQDAPSVEKPK